MFPGQDRLGSEGPPGSGSEDRRPHPVASVSLSSPVMLGVRDGCWARAAHPGSEGSPCAPAQPADPADALNPQLGGRSCDACVLRGRGYSAGWRCMFSPGPVPPVTEMQARINPGASAFKSCSPRSFVCVFLAALDPLRFEGSSVAVVSCGAWASHCRGFPCRRAQAPGLRLLRCSGLGAQQQVGSSWTGD